MQISIDFAVERHQCPSPATAAGTTCLERNHSIPKGRALTADERDYVVDVIARWIERDLSTTPAPSSSRN
jgi:hypothetical protein